MSNLANQVNKSDLPAINPELERLKTLLGPFVHKGSTEEVAKAVMQDRDKFRADILIFRNLMIKVIADCKGKDPLFIGFSAAMEQAVAMINLALGRHANDWSDT